jgi:hypothetical protein
MFRGISRCISIVGILHFGQFNPFVLIFNELIKNNLNSQSLTDDFQHQMIYLTYHPNCYLVNLEKKNLGIFLKRKYKEKGTHKPGKSEDPDTQEACQNPKSYSKGS